MPEGGSPHTSLPSPSDGVETGPDVETGPLPGSRKIYLTSEEHPDVKVAMREITLEPTAGEPPFLVYDPSGPYTDSEVRIDILQGLPPLREPWITARGDTEEYEGRAVQALDDGCKAGETPGVPQFTTRRKPLRAKVGKAVTQLAYARDGIVTPEMEYVALRENEGREQAADTHDGESCRSYPGLS